VKDTQLVHQLYCGTVDVDKRGLGIAEPGAPIEARPPSWTLEYEPLAGQVDRPWQLYPCFALVGVGWATLSTTGISATLAPRFERHQGRSITWAIMGASFGAILGVPLLLYLIDRLGLRGGLLAVGVSAADRATVCA
jgi:MFS family permease